MCYGKAERDKAVENKIAGQYQDSRQNLLSVSGAQQARQARQPACLDRSI